MYELIRAGGRTYYFQCPAKVGLWKGEGDTVWLIDSGNDKEAGKKIKRVLDANGWTLSGILNTHSHADHTGGNAFLQARTGCAVYAPGAERFFTERPLLEPAFLYGGFPPGDLRHKFLMAQPSKALPLTPEVLPEGLEMLPLPGHSWDMTGFRTADGVLFLADCLASRETLEKYRLPFLVDVKAYLETLEAVAQMQALLFVPAHAAPAEEIAPLARLNAEKVYEAAEAICEICAEPATSETVLQKLFDRFGLTMTFEQHALVGSTVRSYLAWLQEEGRLQAAVEDNRVVWKA